MTLYRAALIGCGKIASLYADDPRIKGIYTHAGAYATCPKTKLVAVCDIDAMKAAACAKKWGNASSYTQIEKMLADEQPEIVSICTPDETHADLLELLLNVSSIKGILVEKPLALEVNRATHLVQQAHEKNIVLAVNYNRRYAKGHQKIKQFIANGYLGEIKKVSGYYTKGILHNGTHWLDLAQWLVGDIDMVQGFYLKSDQEADPTLDAWLKFKNNAIGFLHGLDANAYSLFEMDIMGMKGRIRMSHSGHEIEYFNVQDSQHFSGYQSLQKDFQEADAVSDTLLNVVNDLIHAIDNATAPTCSGKDGLAVLKIATNLIKSAEIGSKINLSVG